MPPVLNMPELRIWQDLNMRGLHRVLNMPGLDLTMSQYA